MLSLSPISPSQLQWLHIKRDAFLKDCEKVKDGEEVRHDLGEGLYLTVNVYRNLKVFHLRYFYGIDDSNLLPSKNGVSGAIEKFKELTEKLFSFSLTETCDRRRLIVGQVIQSRLREKLREIEQRKNLPSGSHTCEFFVRQHAGNCMNEIENNMSECFGLYERVASYIEYPFTHGSVVA